MKKFFVKSLITIFLFLSLFSLTSCNNVQAILGNYKLKAVFDPNLIVTVETYEYYTLNLKKDAYELAYKTKTGEESRYEGFWVYKNKDFSFVKSDGIYVSDSENWNESNNVISLDINIVNRIVTYVFVKEV